MYHFIINPRSGSGAGMKKWRVLEDILKTRSIDYRVFFTKQGGDATSYARTLTSEGTSVILAAVGGDGTANEVINGIADFSLVTFGYIPIGSSNDLARALGIPKDPLKALDILLNPRTVKPLNVGYIKTTDSSRRFMVSSGMGFDAAVCHEALHSKLKRILNKVHLGKLTYLGIALKQLILLKPAPLELVLDGKETLIFKQTFFSFFMNTKYEGGGFMFCPDARPDDDILDICIVEKLPKPKVLCILPTAYSGNHVKAKGIHIHRCHELHIKTPHPLAVHTDGESFHLQNDMTVGFLKERLNFILE